MGKKMILSALIFILAAWFGFGCGMQVGRKQKPTTVVIPGGTVAPSLGVGFDATYDPELDDVVPGYKILTVAYTNNSMNLVQMDPLKDEWIVEDRKGQMRRAIINLRSKDPDTWGQLPKKLKVLIEYPLLISIGATETIDLLFKKEVNLGEFGSVIFRAANSNQEYKILPRVD